MKYFLFAALFAATALFALFFPGNLTGVKWQFYGDSQAPIHHTVYVTSPENNSFSASDNSTLQFAFNHTGSLTGIVNCTMFLDSAPVNYTENAGADISVVVYSNTTLFEGARNWWVDCTNGTASESSTDAGGNRTLNIDRTAPGISFVPPTADDGARTTNNWAYINASITDSGSPGNMTAFVDTNGLLVGWWRFNNESGEGSAFFRDWSTYGNNATCSGTNCSTYTGGKFGSALKFDGSNDYVTAGNGSAFSITDKMTFEAWLKPANWNNGVYEGLLSKSVLGESNYIFGKTNTGALAFSWHSPASNTNTVSDNSGATWNNGEWYHVAIVVIASSNTITFYRNGGLLSTNATVNFSGKAMLSNSYNVSIGTTTGYNQYFNGTIDEVRLWKRALSGEDINSSYNAGIYGLGINYTGMFDGTYTSKAYVQDAAGNVNKTENRTIIIDTVKPSITIESPASSLKTNETYLDFNMTASEYLGTATISIMNSSGSQIVSNQQMSNDTEYHYYYSYDIANGDGWYTATFNSTDLAGNRNMTNSTFFIAKDWYEYIMLWTESNKTKWKPDRNYPMAWAAHQVFASEQYFELLDMPFKSKFINMTKDAGVDTVSFHIFPEVWSAYKSNYTELFNQTRDLGLKLWITYKVSSSSGIANWTDYNETQTAFTEEIISNYTPDYYSILVEKGTMEDRMGLDFNDSAWEEVVEYQANLTKSINSSVITIATVMATELDWVDDLVTNVSNLDGIGFNIYGIYYINTDEFQNNMSYVHGNGKYTVIQETWTGWNDPASSEGITHNEFWRDALDANWVEALAYFAYNQSADIYTPFFTGKFVNYTTNATAYIDALMVTEDRTETFYRYQTVISNSNDTVSPAMISGLDNQSQADSWIYWNWTNPSTDFSHAMVYLNGSWKQNTSMNYYNATGLNASTWYRVEIITVDGVGNKNTTWVNSTAKTTVDVTPAEITITWPANASSLAAGTIQTWLNITTNENATCRYNTTDAGYENSTNLTNTGGIMHSLLYAGLANGNTYYIYYWCNDTLGNINLGAALHRFGVSSPAPPPGNDPPSGSSSSTGFLPPAPSGNKSSQNETAVTNVTNETTGGNETLNSTVMKLKAQEAIERVRAKLTEKDIAAKGLLEKAEAAFESGDYEAAYNFALEAETQIIGQAGAKGYESYYAYAGVAAVLIIFISGSYLVVKARTAQKKRSILNFTAPEKAQGTGLAKVKPYRRVPKQGPKKQDKTNKVEAYPQARHEVRASDAEPPVDVDRKLDDLQAKIRALRKKID